MWLSMSKKNTSCYEKMRYGESASGNEPNISRPIISSLIKKEKKILVI
jgi:hypothetical protein